MEIFLIMNNSRMLSCTVLTRLLINTINPGPWCNLWLDGDDVFRGVYRVPEICCSGW